VTASPPADTKGGVRHIVLAVAGWTRWHFSGGNLMLGSCQFREAVGLDARPLLTESCLMP